MIDKTEKIEASKGPKAKLKRKVKALDSCIRTDLLRLSPNDGKAAWLAGLFKAYRDACSQMMAAGWEAARNARIFHPRLRAWIQARAQEKKAAPPPTA